MTFDPSAHTYLVYWPAHNVIKVGFASNLRRRTATYVCRRGGELVSYRKYDGWRDAFAAEDRAMKAVASHWPAAFTSKEEGKPLLGGGGYLECFRIYSEGDLDWAIELFEEACDA